MKRSVLAIMVVTLLAALLPGVAQADEVRCDGSGEADVTVALVAPDGSIITITSDGSFVVHCSVSEIVSCTIVASVGVDARLNFVADQLVIEGSGTGHVVVSCGPATPVLDPPTTSTPGCHVTHGGWIAAPSGGKGTFGGNARAFPEPEPQGEQQYVDHDEFTFHSLEVLAVVCWSDMRRASIFGNGEVDGVGPVRYRIDLTDAGEPGTSDRYRIRLDGGYDSGDQQLLGGNVQLHGGTSEGGRRDSAHGGGQATDETGFGFSAQSDPAGMDAHGHITTKITRAGVVLGQIHARVTCLHVSGNRATLGGRIEQSNAPGGGEVPGLEEGKGVYLFVEDNGEPANEDTTPDRLDFQSTHREPQFCRFFRINTNQFAKGNIVVHDETL